MKQMGTARIVREDETDEEKTARLRQERFERIGVAAAPDSMPVERYTKEYRGRMWFVTREVMQQTEEVLRVAHCWKCEEFNEAQHRIVATRFFVRFEDDPMQNYPALAHLSCHRCGFEEYYPLRHDPRRNVAAMEAEKLRQTMAQKQEAAVYAAVYAAGGGAGGSNQASGMGAGGGGGSYSPPSATEVAMKQREGMERLLNVAKTITDPETQRRIMEKILKAGQ